jgi:YfiH family protein
VRIEEHLIIPQWPVPVGIRAAMTLRTGGYSRPPWDSWNLGDHVGDRSLDVARNRVQLEEITRAHPVFFKQVHGVEVALVNADTPNGLEADACITEHLGVACAMMVADCLPVLFTHRDGTLVAAAHAGWRGLAAGVLGRTVAVMLDHLGKPAGQEGLMAWLGPCIGPNAFEVGDDVRDAFVSRREIAASCFKRHDAKWLANLQGLARQELAVAGLRADAIYGNDGEPQWCTFTNRLKYFSHRRDALSLGSTGRMAACIWRDVQV